MKSSNSPRTKKRGLAAEGRKFGGMRSHVKAPKRRPVVTLQEHSLVRAVRTIAEGDCLVPVGATGTIVDVIRGGEGYYVEFTNPLHAVVAAIRAELAPAE